MITEDIPENFHIIIDILSSFSVFEFVSIMQL